MLPIVWPGVDRDVPSGDGWKGCWTFVRMILGNKRQADVMGFLCPTSLPGYLQNVSNVNVPLEGYMIKVSYASHTQDQI